MRTKRDPEVVSESGGPAEGDEARQSGRRRSRRGPGPTRRDGVARGPQGERAARGRSHRRPQPRPDLLTSPELPPVSGAPRCVRRPRRPVPLCRTQFSRPPATSCRPRSPRPPASCGRSPDTRLDRPPDTRPELAPQMPPDPSSHPRRHPTRAPSAPHDLLAFDTLTSRPKRSPVSPRSTWNRFRSPCRASSQDRYFPMQKRSNTSSRTSSDNQRPPSSSTDCPA
jgi:hypothetical protein